MLFLSSNQQCRSTDKYKPHSSNYQTFDGDRETTESNPETHTGNLCLKLHLTTQANVFN